MEVHHGPRIWLAGLSIEGTEGRKHFVKGVENCFSKVPFLSTLVNQLFEFLKDSLGHHEVKNLLRIAVLHVVLFRVLVKQR